MATTAFVFPGQGSQEQGMAVEFYNNNGVFRETINHLDRVCDFELRRLCTEASSDELQQTHNTQPAVLATGIAAHAAVTDATDVTPDFASGHSLGQYTALAAMGGISIGDGAKLVRKRGEIMGESRSDKNGVMYAVLFADADTVQETCDEFKNASVAGLNTSNQTVISGSKSDIQSVKDELTERTRVRFIELDTGEAFHSPLMNEAATEFATVLDEQVFDDKLRVPIVSDTNGEIYTETEPLIAALSEQIIETVDWRAVMKTLDANDVDVVIEFPPAGTLSGFVDHSFPEKTVIPLESLSDIDTIADAVR